jgi:hypothetical protein
MTSIGRVSAHFTTSQTPFEARDVLQFPATKYERPKSNRLGQVIEGLD